jgi:hypothetical protein
MRIVSYDLEGGNFKWMTAETIADGQIGAKTGKEMRESKSLCPPFEPPGKDERDRHEQRAQRRG